MPDHTVDAKTSQNPSTKHQLGALVIEGKTKKIYQIVGNADLVTVISKDDITAGDGVQATVVHRDLGRE